MEGVEESGISERNQNKKYNYNVALFHFLSIANKHFLILSLPFQNFSHSTRALQKKIIYPSG